MSPTKQAKSDQAEQDAEHAKRSEAAKKAAETRAKNREAEQAEAPREEGAHLEQQRTDHAQGGVQSRPSPSGPLSEMATPDQAEGNEAFFVPPAVHALNRLRRISEVQGFIKHADVARVYDELGLDWELWRDTVRGE